MREQYLTNDNGSVASHEKIIGSYTNKRSLTGAGSFTYELPVDANAAAPLYLSLQYRGQLLLSLEGKTLVNETRDIGLSSAQFALTDSELWADGVVKVTVEDAVAGGSAGAYLLWLELGSTSPFRERVRHVVWDTSDILWQVGYYDGYDTEFSGTTGTLTVGGDFSQLPKTGSVILNWDQAVEPDKEYYLLTGVIGGSGKTVIDMGNDGNVEIERTAMLEVIYDLNITDQVAASGNTVKIQMAANARLDFVTLVEVEKGAFKDEDLRVVFKGSQMADDWTKLANNTMYYNNELFVDQSSGFIDASPPNGMFYKQYWVADAAPMTLEIAKWGYFDLAKQATNYSDFANFAPHASDNGAAGLLLASMAYLMRSDNYEGEYTDHIYSVMKTGLDYYCTQIDNNSFGLIRGNNVETTTGNYGIYNNTIAYYAILAGAEAARELDNTADEEKWSAHAEKLYTGIMTYLYTEEELDWSGNPIPAGTFKYAVSPSGSLGTIPHAGWFGVGSQESLYYGYQGDSDAKLRAGVEKMLATHPGLFWDDWSLYGHNRGFGTTYGVLSERGGWPLTAMFMSDQMDMAKKGGACFRRCQGSVRVSENPILRATKTDHQTSYDVRAGEPVSG